MTRQRSQNAGNTHGPRHWPVRDELDFEAMWAVWAGLNFVDAMGKIICLTCFKAKIPL